MEGGADTARGDQAPDRWCWWCWETKAGLKIGLLVDAEGPSGNLPLLCSALEAAQLPHCQCLTTLQPRDGHLTCTSGPMALSPNTTCPRACYCVTVAQNEPAVRKWVQVSIGPLRPLSYLGSGSCTGGHGARKPVQPCPALQTHVHQVVKEPGPLPSGSQRLAQGPLSLAEFVKCHHCSSQTA